MDWHFPKKLNHCFDFAQFSAKCQNHFVEFSSILRFKKHLEVSTGHPRSLQIGREGFLEISTWHPLWLYIMVGPRWTPFKIAKKSPCLHHFGSCSGGWPQGDEIGALKLVNAFMIFYLSGWWLTYPSEKYESQLGWLFPIYGNIKNVLNHQPVIVCKCP